MSTAGNKRKEVSPKVAKGIPKAPTRKSGRGSVRATYEEMPDVEDEGSEEDQEEEEEDEEGEDILLICTLV